MIAAAKEKWNSDVFEGVTLEADSFTAPVEADVVEDVVYNGPDGERIDGGGSYRVGVGVGVVWSVVAVGVGFAFTYLQKAIGKLRRLQVLRTKLMRKN